MVRLHKIGVGSAGKIGAALYGALGLLFMPLFLLGAGATFATVPRDQRAMSGVFIVMAIFMPLFYAAIGFLIATISAWIYNLLAGRFGGLELEFRDVSPGNVAALPS